MNIDWHGLMMGEMTGGSYPARADMTSRPELYPSSSAAALAPPSSSSVKYSDTASSVASRPRMGRVSSPARPPLRTLESSSAPSRSTSQYGNATLLAPASSSPMASSNASPLHSSDNSSSQASNLRRRPNRTLRANLSVKVLYTLDTNPRATMVAYSDRAASVDVVNLKRKIAEGGRVKSSARFGKITLKTCLRAICAASPELVMDQRNDFVLYAADPIESFRASQKRISSNPRQEIISPSKSSATISSAFMVGKGFLSRALAESDEGTSYIHGRVRPEYADDDDDDNESEEDDEELEDFRGKLLEVTLRLKEAPVATRDQYDDRVRALQNEVLQVQSRAPPEKTFPDLSTRTEEGARSREREGVPTNTPQQQLLQLLQALQSQTQIQEPDNGTSSSASRFIPATTSDSQQSPFENTIQSSVGNQDVIGKLLRTLTAPQGNKATIRPDQETVASEHKAVTNTSTTNTMENTSSNNKSLLSSVKPISDAGSPILGGLTPGYEIDYLSAGQSPAYSAASATPLPSGSRHQSAQAKAATETSDRKSRDKPRAIGAHRHTQCCYNCGLASQSSWRHLDLSDDSVVRFKEGSCTVDNGKRVFRSCNACGLYFMKYGGVSRPEHVWQQSQKNRLKKVGGTIETAADSDAADDEDSTSNLPSTRARSGGISRTLSEACARDSKRISTKVQDKKGLQTDEKTAPGRNDQSAVVPEQVRIRRSAPARRTLDFESARMKDIVLDAEGNWRTKRSILENPAGRRPGRPKGVKTGEGFGRTRNEMNQQRREAQRRAQEAAAAAAHVAPATSPIVARKSTEIKSPRQMTAASSPVRPSHSALAAIQSKTPAGLGKMRYGAPTYLLDSSPATAFQTVMDEADTDWKTLFGMSPRRSPRKYPVGVHGHVNPYASASRTSPAQKADANLDSLLMNATSSSPLTRGRVRSGNFDWAFTSDDIADSKHQEGTSSLLTSPTSPSPSRAKHGSAKRRQNMMDMELQAGPSSEIHERVAKRQKSDTNALLENQDGSNSTGEDDDEMMPGSPTLGRSQRLDKKKRDELGSKLCSSPNVSGMPEGPMNTSSLNAPQEWARTASLRELFPTTSPSKSFMRSPSRLSWESPTAWALRDPTPSPQKIKQGAEDGKLAVNSAVPSANMSGEGPAKTQALQVPREDGQIIRRKPLPATVEDATPSDISNRSPTDDDADAEEEGCALEIDPNDSASMSALMEMFDDPYGLLKASGLTSAHKNNGAQTANADGAGPQMTAGGNASNQPDHLAHVELFNTFDFAQHLDFFHENGRNGVAARVDPGAASHPLPVPNASVQIEGKSRSLDASEQDHARVGKLKEAEGNKHVEKNKESQDANFAAWLNDNKLEALWDESNGGNSEKSSK